MEKFGKGIFGKGFNLKAEVTNGECPLCLKAFCHRAFIGVLD